MYCKRCDRLFNSWSSYDQHLADSPRHYVCRSEDCNRDFQTWESLRQHYIQSPRHHYCRRCGSLFADRTDLIDHCNNAHDWCAACDQFFQNDFGLQEHDRQVHRSHLYCAPCQRFFDSESHLRAHLKSSIHQPKNVRCPFRGCTQSFVSKSALILHLESGSCKSGIDRPTINRFIQEADRNHVITDPSRLLTAGDTTGYVATGRSWNSYINAYECVLCHRAFQSLPDLNRHLASPRHQQKIYRCPLPTCHTTFVTLSALCQHVESERCGVLRFRSVQHALDGLLSGVKCLTPN